MNFDLTIVQRSGYTVLDVLSDIGGLQSTLTTLVSLFLTAWNYQLVENYLASKLFRDEQAT